MPLRLLVTRYNHGDHLTNNIRLIGAISDCPLHKATCVVGMHAKMRCSLQGPRLCGAELRPQDASSGNGLAHTTGYLESITSTCRCLGSACICSFATRFEILTQLVASDSCWPRVTACYLAVLHLPCSCICQSVAVSEMLAIGSAACVPPRQRSGAFTSITADMSVETESSSTAPQCDEKDVVHQSVQLLVKRLCVPSQFQCLPLFV